MLKIFILSILKWQLVMRAQKSDRSRFLLMLVREDRTDEGQELFVGIGVGELGSPTMVEFHKTRMRLITEGTGDRFDAVTDSTFCHSSIVNN